MGNPRWIKVLAFTFGLSASALSGCWREKTVPERNNTAAAATETLSAEQRFVRAITANVNGPQLLILEKDSLNTIEDIRAAKEFVETMIRNGVVDSLPFEKQEAARNRLSVLMTALDTVQVMYGRMSTIFNALDSLALSTTHQFVIGTPRPEIVREVDQYIRTNRDFEHLISIFEQGKSTNSISIRYMFDLMDAYRAAISALEKFNIKVNVIQTLREQHNMNAYAVLFELLHSPSGIYNIQEEGDRRQYPKHWWFHEFIDILRAATF